MSSILIVCLSLIYVAIVPATVTVTGLGLTQRWLIALCPIVLWFAAGLIAPIAYRSPAAVGIPPSDNIYYKRRLDDLDITALLAWLSDERAIESDDQDFFEAIDRAQRIWNAVQKHRSALRPHLLQTVVLEGPFGAGKTSVVNLLQRFVEREGDGRYLVVPVSAWGFSSLSARQHVLNQVIEQLSEHVDCLAVRDLPRDYVDALVESNKWFALLKPSVSQLAPAERLKRLMPILNAIDLHLIVVIEDSDRNDVDFNPQHLQSMLNDFREVERLSFILTVGSASGVDFPKVAEHIETIPRLSQYDALSLIDAVREYCRDNWIPIDPVADEPE